MESRYEISLEQYALSIAVEAKLTYEIGSTIVLPAAMRYQTELALNVSTLRAAGVEADTGSLTEITAPLTALRAALAGLKSALAHEVHGAFWEATHAKDGLLPALNAVRTAADELESIVADDLWPLPTYQEMLYIL
jgi:glutamine synthetase